MLTLQSPVTGNNLLRPKSGRQPLKSLTNVPPPPPPPTKKTYTKPNLNPNPNLIEITEDANKENPNQKQTVTANFNQIRSPIATITSDPVQIEQFEVSLADELIAIREKMERLRLDKEKTEKILKERELMMEMKMKELDQRGEIQKVFEIEVDRLYRLNELRSLCNRILPIRSLREKEQEKIKPDKLQGGKIEELGEEKEEGTCGAI
ncbi:uncharacterized protein [Rutidosis leptorrhynchoides]|uniref:uncharacterized protein n=1 Tax=Rutidosis leptorrhynchoides TaxID=125765 RepID=UPI003A99DE5D